MLDLSSAISVLKRAGCRAIALSSLNAEGFDPPKSIEPLTSFLITNEPSQGLRDRLKSVGWDVGSFSDIPQIIDGVIVIDGQNLGVTMRLAESIARRGCIVIPADRDYVVNADLRNGDAMYCAWKTTSAANYVARCNLRGHYLEFGTFWGRAFFPAYFQLRSWLNGDFYAFDSFAGLSQPLPQETQFTGGDFAIGAYCCNEATFRGIAALLEVPEERLRIVSGYYSDTLEAVSGGRYNLEPGSVSVCVIDCDLREPTQHVLDFVTPLLEDGALIYFDDWRLCRASASVGERAAALRWLSRNPNIELIEFDRDSWQNQWFIFQRRT